MQNLKGESVSAPNRRFLDEAKTMGLSDEKRENRSVCGFWHGFGPQNQIPERKSRILKISTRTRFRVDPRNTLKLQIDAPDFLRRFKST